MAQFFFSWFTLLALIWLHTNLSALLLYEYRQIIDFFFTISDIFLRQHHRFYALTKSNSTSTSNLHRIDKPTWNCKQKVKQWKRMYVASVVRVLGVIIHHTDLEWCFTWSQNACFIQICFYISNHILYAAIYSTMFWLCCDVSVIFHRHEVCREFIRFGFGCAMCIRIWMTFLWTRQPI